MLLLIPCLQSRFRRRRVHFCKSPNRIPPMNAPNWSPAMRHLALISRPISKFTSNSPRFQHAHAAQVVSNHESDVSKAVLSVVDSVDPMEHALERFVPFLSPDTVTFVIQQQQNPKLGFRFFAWAMRRKTLRSWDSHDLVIDMLLRDNGFDLYWKALEEVRSSGFPLTSPSFCVLIAAYERSGKGEKAVQSFCRMKDFDCKPDVFTYNSLLHVLLRKEVFLLALAVYNQMMKHATPNRATFSILIDGLCKNGRTSDALRMFDEMTKQGISPNTMIHTIILCGLCKAKRIDDAFRLFGSMSGNGCSPDFITYNALLAGFFKSGRFNEAFMLLQSFRKEGYFLGRDGYNKLIDGLLRDRRYVEVAQWHGKMIKEGIEPDINFYTIMIRGLSELGKLKDASGLMNIMTKSGIVPDINFYNALIKGFCKLGLLNDAQSLKLQISSNYCFPNSWTYTILIWGLCRNGLVGEAYKIFKEMEKHGCVPSVVTFNALMLGLCKAGDLQQAQLMYSTMEIGRNTSSRLRISQGIDRVHYCSSLHTMVEKLCESGLIDKAYRLLMKLSDSGVLPNITTVNILINGYCKARDLDVALKLFKQLSLKGLSPNSITYCTIIDGLLRVGRDKDAYEIFDQMTQKECIPSSSVYKLLMCRNGNVSLSFSLWLKYLRNLHGQENKMLQVVEEHFYKREVEKAIRTLLEMDLSLHNFDLGPYAIWIIGLCRAGRLEEALMIFYMLEECGINVNPPSCVMLIDGLCRSGNLDVAVDIFHYSLDKKFILGPQICNRLLSDLFYSNNKIAQAFDCLNRMKSAGYDVDGYLYPQTMSLFYSHLSNQE